LIAELIYTSVPKGLAAGRSGFCTAAYTEGIPKPLILTCESLSSYRHLFPPGDRQEALNPVLFAHAIVTRMDKPFSVVSRVSAYGADYSGRTNMLAHHLVLSPEHRVPQGPARVLQIPHLMRCEWTQEPAILPFSPWLGAAVEPLTYRANAWEKLTGWAGWAGVLANSFVEQPRRAVYLIFQPGLELLPLLTEAIDLLPPALRWQATFSTYCTALPQGVECLWRCCLPTADFLPKVRKQADAFILDLTGPLERPAIDESNPWVRCAVSGERPDWSEPSASASVEPTAVSFGVVQQTGMAAKAGGHRRTLDAPEDSTQVHKSAKPGLALAGLLLAAAAAVWRLPDLQRETPPSPESPAVEPVASNGPSPVAETTPVDVPVVPETPETSVPIQPAEESTASIPSVAEEPPKAWELAFPQVVRESMNTFRLIGLPTDIAGAARISFYLAPGYRISRTNGTLFAAGVSGALAGRGSGEMNLTVGHPTRGLDEISLRLKHDELQCSARAEWLACLQAIQFDFPTHASRLVLCAAPWRFSSLRLQFLPEPYRLLLPLTGEKSEFLSKAILSFGAEEMWNAHVQFNKGPAFFLTVKPRPDESAFELAFSEKECQWLALLQRLRERKSYREWPAAEPAEGGEWEVLKALLTDWLDCGWDARKLLEPLRSLAQTSAAGIPLEPIPEAADVDALMAYCQNALIAAPASDIRATVQKMCLEAQTPFAGALAPLFMLETGKGLDLGLRYGDSLFIVMEEH